MKTAEVQHEILKWDVDWIHDCAPGPCLVSTPVLIRCWRAVAWIESVILRSSWGINEVALSVKETFVNNPPEAPSHRSHGG